MNNNLNATQQMELPLTSRTLQRRVAGHTLRASWWFTQMRRAADCAATSYDQSAPARAELQPAIS